MSVFDRVDRWIVADARRHKAARDSGAFWQQTLPGPGFWKYLALFMIVPLLVSEIVFMAGLPALPPKVVILALFGVLGVYVGRYFAHSAALRSGKLSAKESDR